MAWTWLVCCLETDRDVDTALLRSEFAQKADRQEILAWFLERSVSEVEGLHMSADALDARVVDATLPLLAVYEEFATAFPTGAPDDLLEPPKALPRQCIQHLSRNLSLTVLACALHLTQKNSQGSG